MSATVVSRAGWNASSDRGGGIPPFRATKLFWKERKIRKIVIISIFHDIGGDKQGLAAPPPITEFSNFHWL